MEKVNKVVRLEWLGEDQGFDITETHVVFNKDNEIKGGWGNRDIQYNPIDKSKRLDISSIKTIYFGPKVSVPRQRVRPFLDANNIKIIRDMSKADAIISCADDYDFNLVSYWGHACKIESMIFFLKRLYGTAEEKNAMEAVQKLQALIDNNTLGSNHVLFTSHNLNDLFHKYHPNCVKGNGIWGQTFSNPHDDDFNNEEDAAGSGFITEVRDMSVYDPAYISKCYDQEVLLSCLGSNVIDEEGYKSLKDMFESMDPGNHLIAMTIMAESDFSQSFVYLASLFEKYGNHQIYNHPYKNTVAFKSLVKWIGYKRHNFNKDRILRISLEKKLLTKELLNTIKQYYLEGSNTFSDNFVVSDIKLIDEMQKTIDNYFKE